MSTRLPSCTVQPMGMEGSRLMASALSSTKKIEIIKGDAHLAIRCWRDLDSATVSEDPELHAQALGQLDTALDYGYALMVAAQLRALAQNPDTTGIRVVLSILGPTLKRALLERDPELEGAWSSLWAELADENVTLNTDTLSAAAEQVEAVFSCP